MNDSVLSRNAKDIKGSVNVHTTCGLPVMLVFVRNRNKTGMAGDWKKSNLRNKKNSSSPSENVEFHLLTSRNSPSNLFSVVKADEIL